MSILHENSSNAIIKVSSQSKVMQESKARVQGYIPKELLRLVKFKCLTLGVNLTQGIEQAILDWLDSEGAD